MPRKKKPEKKAQVPAVMEGKRLELLAPIVTKTELKMPEGFTTTDWTRVGEALCITRGAVAWWVGDWINQGEDRLEQHEAVQLACTLLNIEPGTATTYASVCRTFGPERRRDLLSFEHHKEVRGMDRRHQDKWLDEAAGQKWSKADLRRNMKEAGVKQQPKLVLSPDNGPRRTTVELYEKFKEYMEQAPLLWEPLDELLGSIRDRWETRLPSGQVLDMVEKTIEEFVETLHRLQATTLELEKLEATHEVGMSAVDSGGKNPDPV